ncbi:MAG: hypothetical protein JW910_23020 [Anaerolineae bacterium]|nr:hypothetical protein [Anaerolineae bacterium]
MNRRLFTVLAVSLVALLVMPLLAGSQVVLAQGSLDYTQTPTYGSASLQSGFTPDPYTVNMVSGGSVNVNADIGSVCNGTARGYAASAPDFRIQYTAGAFNTLRFYFESSDNGDTTMVVNYPNGDWYCDDDSHGGLQPEIAFSNPSSGQYDIWVGSYGQGDFHPGTLFISELGGGSSGTTPTATPVPTAVPSTEQVLDYSLPANYGTEELTSGWTPDPFAVDVMSGGDVSVIDAVGDVCQGGNPRGYVTSAPDFSIYYTSGNFDELRFFFSSEGDTTMVINAPNAQWYCDDDSGDNLQPLLAFTNPMSGRYDVWVGSYSEGSFHPGILYVTELSYDSNDFPYTGSIVPGQPIMPPLGSGSSSPATGLDYTQPATYGSANLTSGFTPDPYTVRITSGGPVDVYDELGDVCEYGNARGYVNSAPDFSVNYTAGSFDTLRFTFVADDGSDTTMVINGPTGTWLCDDDGADEPPLQPEIVFQNPASGRYDVWIGSYSEGRFYPGTLSISELGSGAAVPTVVPPPPPAAGGLDYSMSPNYGSTSLTSGFMPDPFTVSVTSGGSVSINNAVGSQCTGSARGYSTSAPDFSLSYTAGSFPRLRFYFESSDNGDTTMVINAPNAQWYCDDDSHGGLQPEIVFQNPSSGRYDIWVGSYSEGDFHPGTLFISELSN